MALSAFPTDLIQLLDPHQHVSRLAAFRGAEDPDLLQLVDNARRPAVADAHAPLQQRGRANLVLDAHLGGLPEQEIPRAFAPPPPPPRSPLPGPFPLCALLHLLGCVPPDPLLDPRAA